MLEPAPTDAPKIKNLARTALTMLTSDDLIRESKCHDFEAGTAVIDMPPACAKVDDVGTDANVAPLARASLPEGPLDIAIGDWDDLFRAVEARLRLTVGERLAATTEPQAHDTAGRIQVIVLECVAALDQLHTALTHERGRRHQLELEVLDAQAALAQMRAELVGIQAK